MSGGDAVECEGGGVILESLSVRVGGEAVECKGGG